MAVEQTLSIIKPDAVAKNAIGEIVARFEKAGLKPVAMRMMHLSREQAESFYDIHKERPFFNDLVEFMISGPVLVQALEGENAILKTVRSWVRQILKKRKKVLFVQILLTVLLPMQCMVLMRPKQLRVKFSFSLSSLRFAPVHE